MTGRYPFIVKPAGMRALCGEGGSRSDETLGWRWSGTVTDAYAGAVKVGDFQFYLWLPDGRSRPVRGRSVNRAEVTRGVCVLREAGTEEKPTSL